MPLEPTVSESSLFVKRSPDLRTEKKEDDHIYTGKELQSMEGQLQDETCSFDRFFQEE